MAAPQYRAMTWDHIVTKTILKQYNKHGERGGRGGHLNAALEHVSERQVTDVNVGVLQLHAREPRAGCIGDDVAVTKHSTFGVASCTAGEADGGEHVGAGAVESVGGKIVLARGFNLLERMNNHADCSGGGGFIRGGRTIHEHYVLKRVGFDL